MKQLEHDTTCLDMDVIAEFKTNRGNVQWYILLVMQLFSTRCWPFACAQSTITSVIKLVTAMCTMSVQNEIGSETVVQLIQCYVDGNPGVVDQIKSF
jgi:hypothetical protein